MSYDPVNPQSKAASESTLDAVLRLIVNNTKDLWLIARAAAKEGAIDVLRAMLDAGVVKPTSDPDRDVEFYASVLPIVDTYPDRGAAQKVVDDVRAAFGGFAPDVLAHGFSLLHDPELIRPMVAQGADLHAWLHRFESKETGESVLSEMMNPSRLPALRVALDILAEREEVPLFSYSVEVPGEPIVYRTLFDRLLGTRNSIDYALEKEVAEYLVNLQERGTLPHSWSVAIGEALVDYSLKKIGTVQPAGESPWMIEQVLREPVILPMLRLATFDDVDDWVLLLGMPVRRFQPPLAIYLASGTPPIDDALAILAATVRDGLHPDDITSKFGSDHTYTWLAGAVNLNSPRMTQALLELGADPNCKPEKGSMSPMDEAKAAPSNESSQSLQAWLAKRAIDHVLQQVIRPSNPPSA